MKKIALLIVVLFAGAQFLMAQNQNPQPAKQPQPVQQAKPAQPAAQPAQQTQVASTAPKTYAWNETTHDFGKIKQNDPASVTFTVKNSGTTPLIITAAKSSCGCTVAEYTKEPIKPNETGVVKATYNSARVGVFTKTVTVTYDGIANPDILTIKGEVEGGPTPAPAPGTPAPAPTPQPAPEKK
jgi:hypothetical protein